MTVANTSCVNRYTGNGGTSQYAFQFPINQASDLVVETYTPSTDTFASLALGADYTIPAAAVNVPAGGTITLTAGNLAAATQIVLRRIVPYTQPSSFRNQSDFRPQTHENAFDSEVMRLQQVVENLARTVQLKSNVDPAAFDPTLPPSIAGKGGLYLVTNANGTGFILAQAVAGLVPCENVTADLTITAVGPLFVSCDCTANAITVKLPDVAQAKGSVINIFKTDVSGHAVSIQKSDGTPISAIGTQGNSQFFSNGVNWLEFL